MYLYLSALIRTRIHDQRGSSAVEYGLLIAGIAIGLIAVSAGFGKMLEIIFLGECAQAQNGTSC